MSMKKQFLRSLRTALKNGAVQNPLGAGAAPAVAAFTTDLVRTSDAYRGWRDSPFVHPFLNDSRAPRNTQVFSPSHEAWRKHPMLQVSYRSMCAPPDVLDPAVAI